MVARISSREFNQNSSGDKKAATHGPVYLTDRGRPAHSLLSYQDDERLLATTQVLDRLAEPAGVEDIEVVLPTCDGLARPLSCSCRRSRSTGSSTGCCSPSVLIDPEEPCCVVGSMRGRGSLRSARPRRRREGRATRGSTARPRCCTLPRCAHRRDLPDPWDDVGHPQRQGRHQVRRARPRRSVAPVGNLAPPDAGA